MRDRREDIPLLTMYFLQGFAGHLHQDAPSIDNRTLRVLQEYDWPGNVRELEHTVKRAVILARDGSVMPEHLGIGVVSAADASHSSIVTLAEHERQYLNQVLQLTNGVIHGDNGAAVLLGIKPTTLRSRMARLGVDKPQRRAV